MLRYAVYYSRPSSDGALRPDLGREALEGGIKRDGIFRRAAQTGTKGHMRMSSARQLDMQDLTRLTYRRWLHAGRHAEDGRDTSSNGAIRADLSGEALERSSWGGWPHCAQPYSTCPAFSRCSATQCMAGGFLTLIVRDFSSVD